MKILKMNKRILTMVISIAIIIYSYTGYNLSASSTLDVAKSKLDSAKIALDDANTELSNANKAFEAVKGKNQLRSKGSLGFFEYYGYTDAAKVLKRTDAWIVNNTNIGKSGDSTSLDNLKAIVPLLKEANTVRANEKIDPVSGKALYSLKVSMKLIAIEEVHTNWSANVIAHAGSNVSDYSISENLSWGNRDPFVGWIDNEKPIWAAAKSNTSAYPNLSKCTTTYAVYTNYPSLYQSVGHYLNACNSGVGVMGFAINQKSNQYIYTKGMSMNPASGYSDILTVSEFENKINAYCSYVESEESKYNSAYNRLQVAKNTQAECQKAYDEAYKTYNDLYESLKGHNDSHKTETIITPATTTSNGKKVVKCIDCNEIISTSTIYAASNISISNTSYTYNGEVKKPTVVVKDSKGNVISSSYYTVAYSSGRINVGTYYVKVTLKGKYSGSEKIAFKIKPPKTTIANIIRGTHAMKVEWTKQSKQVTGYQIHYSTKSDFSVKKSIMINSYSTAIKTIKELKSNTKYYVRIRTYKTVNGENYFSSWSPVKYIVTK